ncbi:transposase [Candidatus Cardinium hertigii]|uniref:transposase n=1 Tax=Candidatus Cardinium hertigii TaxID=247481 RepID=UPI003D7EBE83
MYTAFLPYGSCGALEYSGPKKLVKSLQTEDINDYFTYIHYLVQVRRMIYTTNSIENLNRQIRRVTKTKVTFDKADNLLDETISIDFVRFVLKKYFYYLSNS